MPVIARRRTRGLAWREYVEGYLFILPWILGFLIFTAGPMVASLVISLNDWEIITPARFVGLANYGKLFTDKLFWTALYNTAYYTFIAVPLHIVIAFLLALLLDLRVRGVNLFRTVYYLPTVTPAVANAMVWLWFLHPDFGLVNSLLRLLHLGIEPQWLFDPATSKASLILMSLFTLGGTMIIFLAGLKGVPEHLYEAASIDGANGLRRFWHITVPMVTPVLWFNLIMQIIGCWQVFTAAYIMTGGGPMYSTWFMVLYLYTSAFTYLRMGYASALAWALFAIIMAFTLMQFRLADRWVYYEGELRRV